DESSVVQVVIDSAAARNVREGIEGHQVRRRGIDLRHLIVRKRRRTAWNVQDCPGQQRGEVTRTESRRRDGVDIGLRLTHALAFVIGEEEQLVLAVEHVGNYYRAAQVRAEFVHVERRDGIGG